MLVGIIAAIVVYTIFLIAFLLDDRIRSDEDIEKYLHLSILGDIPSADDMKKITMVTIMVNLALMEKAIRKKQKERFVKGQKRWRKHN